MRDSSFLEGLIRAPLDLALVWVAACSVLGFALCAFDKTAAQRGAWRVPERIFFIVAVIGGAIGILCGVKVFRHKIRKDSFQGVLGLILLGQVLLGVWLSRISG